MIGPILMNIPFLPYLANRFKRPPQQPAYPILLPASPGPSRGTVLFSYITKCLTFQEDDPRLKGHSNLWECQTITQIFNQFNYDVEAIRWDDWGFRPRKQYDVIFDISSNIPRLATSMDHRPLLMLHRTGADAFFQNTAELLRIKAMEERRHVTYCPKRLVPFTELERLALEMADSVTLLGNEYTRQTYPTDLRDKMRLVPVSGSDVRGVAKTSPYVSPTRAFLCFSGSGGVHKGIDLLLEIFGTHPELTLHIVGDVGREPDFKRAYFHELTAAPNIHCHSFLPASDPQFKTILDSCFAFLLPSCSEGMSPAVVTCMQLGLYPVISRATGVTLPEGCGRYLDTCTLPELESTITELAHLPAETLEKEIEIIQAYANNAFSRKAFRSAMEQAIGNALENLGKAKCI